MKNRTRKKLIVVCRTGIKFLAVSIIWLFLEMIFYGEVQPRVVDDIIGLFLIYYIYRSEQRYFWRY